uniref:condensation domain-containing protein n=1 Tax=Nocardia sienata TaxID=248552 RepID=UPI000B1AA1BD
GRDLAADVAVDINAVVTDTADGPILRAGLSFPTAVLTPGQVEDLARWWTTALTALATHATTPGAGGLTPSDLALLELSQTGIETLEHRFPTVTEVWPLAPLQTGLLFHALLAEESVDAYLVQLVLHLRGVVQPDRLRTAATALLQRHPNLGTAFLPNPDPAAGFGRDPDPGAGFGRNPGSGKGSGRDTDVMFVQVVTGGVEVPVRVVDLSGVEEPARGAAVERLLRADRAASFDMADPPLLRLMLIMLGAQDYRLVLTNHHILLDGWSTPLLIRELLLLYATTGETAGGGTAGETAGETAGGTGGGTGGGGDGVVLPRVFSYRRYLAWLAAQDVETSRRVWAQALAGTEEPTLLARAGRGRQLSGFPHETAMDLSEDHTRGLARVARELGVTVNTMIQVAWGVVVAMWTGREDVVFGGVVSGRPAQVHGIEDMIGLFINTVPVRVTLDHRETLTRLLTRVQAEQAGLLDHHYLGLTDIQQAAGPGARFDTLTVFESYPVEHAAVTEAGDRAGIEVTGLDGHDATHYPLTLAASGHTRLHLALKYLPDLFDPTLIDSLLTRLTHILHTLTTDIDLPLARLELLTP